MDDNWGVPPDNYFMVNHETLLPQEATLTLQGASVLLLNKPQGVLFGVMVYDRKNHRNMVLYPRNMGISYGEL